MKIPGTKIETPAIAIPDISVELPEVDLGRIDREAIGRALADRLPRRRGPVMPLLLIGVLWGAALSWFAFARSAAPLRAGLLSWIEETRQRIPSAVDEVRDWAGGTVYRAGDRVEHSGDALIGEEIERVGEGIETPPIG